MNKYIRKGDLVVCTAGNDKGLFGKVTRRLQDKVVVSGLNRKKRHTRKSQAGPGRIIDVERPIHISNLAFASPEGKPLKVKVRQNASGDKELVSGKESTVVRSIKKGAK